VKVVHVTMRFTPPGGIVTNILETAHRLRAFGDEAEVYASDVDVASGAERRMDRSDEVEGVPVRRFAVPAAVGDHLSVAPLRGLTHALEKSGADVIHAHNHRFAYLLQAASAARRARIPFVVTTYYHPAHAREGAAKRGLIRLADRGFGVAVYRTARAIVVWSNQEARRLASFAPSNRFRLVPPGIDLAEWAHPVDDSAPGLGLPARYFLYAGRVASAKGLEHLVEALARLPPEFRLPLVLMGSDGGARAGLEEQARRLGVANSLIWTPPQPRHGPAYRAVVRGAAAFVLPSEWESFGLVLLDALAARTPIVATGVGAIPEVLDGGAAGLLVPYGDVPAIADALRTVLQDPDGTRTRVARGWERVSRMDWADSARQLHEVYRTVTAP
jgi:glycosyltransferase involved in cell wall biosynthesis